MRIIALLSTLSLASPGVAILDATAVEKRTDVAATVRLVEKSVEKDSQTPPNQITTIVVEITKAKGPKAAQLPVGSKVRFVHRCSLDAEPLPAHLVGYPNGRCGTGWTRIPAPFDGAKGAEGPAALTLGPKGEVALVVDTEPAIGGLSGVLLKP